MDVGDTPPSDCGVVLAGVAYSLGTRLNLSSFSSVMESRRLLLELGECTYSGGLVALANPATGDAVAESVLPEASGAETRDSKSGINYGLSVSQMARREMLRRLSYLADRWELYSLQVSSRPRKGMIR